MPLHPHLISSLDQVVAPLAALLATPADDPFTPELIVAPSVGVQQWLAERLARSLGAAAGRDDGIVANIRFDFPGALVTRALGGRVFDDPWSVERLTFTVLDVLAAGDAGIGRNRLERGRLPAARGLADLLDRYHYHRPGMILDWAQGRPALTAVHEEPVPALPERERWQYDLWRAAQARIAMPSPPERVAAALAGLRSGERPDGLPARIAIVGVTAMSPLHLSVVHALADVIDVHLWLSHPSPALVRSTRAALQSLPRHTRFATAQHPARNLAALPQLESWTRGAQSMQVLLASEGIAVDTDAPATPEPPSDSVLARVQYAVRSDALGPPVARSAADDSLRIHRCHGPARQAEVLRDALLHTFKEIPGLDPREVLIVAPNIGAMAPHLEAVFGEARSADPDDPLHLPVVVADRSLRQVSEVAELLGLLTDLTTSRFGLADFRAITAIGVVQRRLGVDASTIETWLNWATHLHVRWGLNPAHRAHVGLSADLTEYSWLHAARRLAYGALLPDAAPAIELGGVIPATGLEVGEIAEVGALAQLLSALAAFVDAATSGPRVTSEWCDVMQAALDALCRVERGDEPQLAAALRVLGGVRTSASDSATPVTFGEFRTLLAPLLSGDPGQVSLRSGRITATSLVPLRGVPYRVICLVGLDDGALSSGDGDGDDLTRQHPLVGDPDTRAEQRQALLETLMAAGERVIITCTGRDPRSNGEVPFITPVAELVDLITAVTGDGKQVITEHPRHAMDARNFESEKPFGHVEAHLRAARVLAGPQRAKDGAAAEVELEPQAVISIDDLVTFASNPLDIYVKRTLGLDGWEAPPEPGAVIDVEAGYKTIAGIAEPLLDAIRERRDDEVAVDAAVGPWQQMVRRSGELPPKKLADPHVASAEALVRAIQIQCTAKGIPMRPTETIDVRVEVGGGRVIVGAVEGVVAGEPSEYALVKVMTDANSDRERLQQLFSTWLYAIHVNDVTIKSFVVGMKDDDAEKSYARAGRVLDEIRVEGIIQGLTELVRLYDEASRAPRPMFGKTASKLGDVAAAQREFGNLFERPIKSYTSEFRLYGDSPSFEQIFDDETRSFFHRFFAVLAGTIEVKNSVAKPNKWPKPPATSKPKGKSK
jgi:exodeoxyribonuclease V gamma subunit